MRAVIFILCSKPKNSHLYIDVETNDGVWIYKYIYIYINKQFMVPCRKSNVSSVGPSSEPRKLCVSLSDEGLTLETLDFAFYIGSADNFL